jgi:hypothetical protein
VTACRFIFICIQCSTQLLHLTSHTVNFRLNKLEAALQQEHECGVRTPNTRGGNMREGGEKTRHGRRHGRGEGGVGWRAGRAE